MRFPGQTLYGIAASMRFPKIQTIYIIWNSSFLSTLCQRIFQHTPGTYPTRPTNSLWFGIPFIWGCLVGYAPGVYWGSLRNDGSE